MESNVMSGRNPDILGLEMSLHHHIPPPPPQNSPLLPQQKQLQMVSYGHNEADYHPQAQKSSKQGYPFSVKSKNQTLTLSDDDEPSADDCKKKASPWQRMKWTDDMVRLLIVVVFYIGDEVGSEGNDLVSNKKKSGVILQKKGKWKSVSRALMERGFYVSPQQCEDKFNDLNKRYKRVNEILGKGTACQVVENQSLLDSMDHLSPKMKEEVKKLLNSKHLFFREMCAYHNSCGQGGAVVTVGGGGGGGVQHSPIEVATEPPQGQVQHQQQRCFHSTESIPKMPNVNRGENNEGSKSVKGICVEDDYGYDDEESDEDESDEEESDDINDMDERTSRKRDREWSCHSSSQIRQLESELISIMQDGVRSPFEKRQWMRTKLMQLEEQSVGIQYQSLELEKQRLKWLKFSSKKEREMEREKLLNEKTKLENERLILLIRRKEHDFDHHHRQIPQQSSNKKSDPSSISR